jgi:predicted flap endonuclease-1-like 5' DNA nuclease
MATLESIKDLSPDQVAQLQTLGIAEVSHLLEKAATPKGRQELAQATGIELAVILRCANLSDLSRVKGIGREYADMLEAVGIDSVPELAQRNPENLYQKLAEVNTEKKIVSLLPTPELVQNWVKQAKELPRVLTY